MAANTVSLLILCFMAMNCANFAVPAGARSLDLIKLGLLGGSNDLKGFQNGFEIESLGKFAVEEQNKKQNGLLEFVKVVKAKEQVVAGKLYYLTLEAIEAGRKKTFEAKVWVKPWMNFKQLTEFKPIEGGLSITRSDLGVEQGGHGSGWKAVSTNDPEVQNTANHAVKLIQQRSNSLSPYKLLKILLAKAKVIEDEAKFNLLLKLRRGMKEEDLDVKVTKDKDGKYYLN